MTLTGFTLVSDHFVVGAAAGPPLTISMEDGGEYWQTTDGTANITPTNPVLSIWKYEETTDNWLPQPLGGGTTCPGPMTRSALLSLRNSGNLTKDCHYVITDYSRGTVGAATILLHAVDVNRLGMAVSVVTGFDTLAWSGRYDIDTNRLVELSDEDGNTVSGQEIVDVFPWGNASVTDNDIHEGATFSYTAGAFRNNVLQSDARVVQTSGTTERNHFEADSDATLAGSVFRENRVEGDATVNITGTANVNNSTFGATTGVTVSGGTVNAADVRADGNFTQTAGTSTGVVVVGASNYVNNGATVAQATVTEDANATFTGGSHLHVRVSSSYTLTQTGNRNIRYCSFDGNGVFTVANVTLTDVHARSATVTTVGSTGSIVRSTFDATTTINVQNIPTLDILGCTLTSQAQVSAAGATRLRMRYSSVSGGGRVLVSASRTMLMDYCTIDGYGYMQCLNGTMTISYSVANSLGYIRHNSPNANRFDRCAATSQSNIRIEGTATNCRVYYTSTASGATAYIDGASNAAYMYYCAADSYGILRINSSASTRMYYGSATGRGQVICQGDATSTLMYYCHAASGGIVQSLNNDAAGTRMYSCNADSQSILRLQNSGANGRVYYSSVTAYYYLLLTLNGVTRSALHGYGRRSYTVTNPPNGTFVQNF